MSDATGSEAIGQAAPEAISTTAPAEPRWLYLHGFGSSPQSVKARAVSAHFAAKGIEVEALDLRRPSFERMRLSAMIAHVRDRIGDGDAASAGRAVVFGSSLGGLTAARAAEEDARIFALVLLAPAFRMAERWRVRVGEDAWRRYRDTGWAEADDYLEKRKRQVDFGFFEDVAALDARSGGWPDVRVPTLIVHGVRDDVVDVELSRAWARGRRHVRLIEVDDGHELAASLPRILSESESFLANVMGASGNR